MAPPTRQPQLPPPKTPSPRTTRSKSTSRVNDTIELFNVTLGAPKKRSETTVLTAKNKTNGTELEHLVAQLTEKIEVQATAISQLVKTVEKQSTLIGSQRTLMLEQEEKLEVLDRNLRTIDKTHKEKVGQ